jgi:hypothetical protein
VLLAQDVLLMFLLQLIFEGFLIEKLTSYRKCLAWITLPLNKVVLLAINKSLRETFNIKALAKA